MKQRVRVALLTVVASLAAANFGNDAHAIDDDASALFAQGSAALADGRPADAIAALEALADRGVVDPVASYDRGLAYAMRARIGTELPGDLGRAAHGFEEARELSRDAALIEDASRALAAIHSEVARRRMREGEPVEVDPGRSLAHAVAKLLSEDTWSVLGILASVALAVGLFIRAFASERRIRISGGVAAGVAAPILVVAVSMTLAARHDRTRVREAVVVVGNARPTDERGITIPGGTPLPEGARVELVETEGARSRVRYGTIEARIPSGALRELARADL